MLFCQRIVSLRAPASIPGSGFPSARPVLFRNVIPTERGPSLPVCVRHRPQRPQLATVAWSAVTSTLLPEKTVEIWTAITVSRALPAAQLWSPPNYKGSVDQWIRAGKTWAFELKTPTTLDVPRSQSTQFNSKSTPTLRLMAFQFYTCCLRCLGPRDRLNQSQCRAVHWSPFLGGRG